MKNQEKFKMTIQGCSEARKWLQTQGAWTPRTERMDGYSLVHYANDLYNQPKTEKNDTILNQSRQGG